MRHLSRLLRLLVTTPTASRRTSLGTGLVGLRRRARRGLVVVLSDFLDPEPVRPWREVATRHDVMALRLVDPREERLPPSGLVAIEDLESGRRRARWDRRKRCER